MSYIRQHFENGFNLKSYAYAGIFLAVFITLNYRLDFENKYLDVHIGTFRGICYNMIFFGVAYFGTAVPVLWLNKQAAVLGNGTFWIKSAWLIGSIGVFNGYYLFSGVINSMESYSDYVYLFYLSNALKGWFFYLIPVLLAYYFFDRQEKNIYGLHMGGVNYRPYLLLLLMAVPFVVYASFQPDFLVKYPFFKPWKYPVVLGMDSKGPAVLFELAYGVNFIFLEWMFRGALVIGMAGFMGRNAILPMAVTYAFLHFGKPLPETIASIFGGYLLGIIAYYSRSIFAGCLIHICIAYLMDGLAYLQYYLGRQG